MPDVTGIPCFLLTTGVGRVRRRDPSCASRPRGFGGYLKPGRALITMSNSAFEPDQAAYNFLTLMPLLAFLACHKSY